MSIQHLSSIPAARAQVKAWRAEGHTVGFVPTMGALHRGHISLVQIARKRNARVITSIFVNPTQFAPTEDLSKYPRDLPGDMQLLEAGGCHAVFTTSPEEMYPPGFATWVTVEGLTNSLCGKSRPTHFRGVTTVVTKLFNIVQPDDAYLGEKDRQQLQVLKRMAKDLDMPLSVHGCPILRETDGLAMSSRNRYLSADERQAATCLSRGLRAARQAFATGERNARTLEGIVKKELEGAGARLDYIDAVDLETLQTVEQASAQTVLAVACFVGRTRLIDNHLLGEVFPV